MSASTNRGITRPFHETIVTAIRRCGSTNSHNDIFVLLPLIKETTITEGHDEIIAAINKYFNFPGAGKWSRETGEVKRSLLEQKQDAAVPLSDQ